MKGRPADDDAITRTFGESRTEWMGQTIMPCWKKKERKGRKGRRKDRRRRRKGMWMGQAERSAAC